MSFFPNEAKLYLVLKTSAMCVWKLKLHYLTFQNVKGGYITTNSGHKMYLNTLDTFKNGYELIYQMALIQKKFINAK